MLRLRELIKKVRSCKTAEEERSLVNKEMAEMRNMSREQSDQLKARNLAKCIFIHMLGHQTNFMQMTCVNLLSSSKYSEKRIAYIALCVIMDERSEVLLLTANTIKKDLENSNQFIVSIALNSIGEACTADMCRQLSGEVVKLMKSPNPYIKKKAALACSKIVRKCPDLLEIFIERLHSFFDDKNHGVILCGASLAVQIFKSDFQYVEGFRKHISAIMKYLRNLVSTNYAPEYDINGVSDPFLQVKLLEILQQFGKGNADASDDMNDLLASISTNTETNKNTGNAVLYELVRCIINIESNPGLMSLASTILGRFLAHKDNNYKYIALNTLQIVAKIDINAVQKHKSIILECMKDTDISIKRRALDLVYLIINSFNIKPIIKECLNYLIVAEAEIKLELTTKICQSLDKYAPSLKWQIDTLIKMLCLCGSNVLEETLSSIINLIVSTTELHLYTIHKIFLAVKNNLGQEGLVKVSLYVLGEFGYILVNKSVTGPDNETVSVSEDELMSILSEIHSKKYSNQTIKEYLMNCCVKLSSRLSESSCIIMKKLIDSETVSIHPEVQQRANEYLIFFGLKNHNLKSIIMETIPNHKNNKESESNKRQVYQDDNDGDDDIKITNAFIKVETNQMEKKEAPKKETNQSNLINFGNIFNDPTPSSLTLVPNNKQIQQNPNDTLNTLESIFGNMNLLNQPQPSVPASQSNNNLLIGNTVSNNPTNNNDQLSNIFSSINLTEQVQPTVTQNNNFNLFNVESLSQPQQASSSLKQVYKNNDLTLYSTLKITDKINSIYTFSISNNVNSQIQNIKLQYSFPKYIEKVINQPSQNFLPPLASFAIQQNIQVTNPQPEKQLIIKLRLIYSIDGKEITETITLDDL